MDNTMIKKLKFLVSLCVLMSFASGCARLSAVGIGPLVVYRMRDNTYLARSGAEGDQRKALRELLLKTPKASDPVAERCVLVMPTYEWIKDNYAWCFWVGNSGCAWVRAFLGKEAIRDYLAAAMQRQIETGYAMLEKSGLFKDCKIVFAEEGNGANEYFTVGGSFVVRAEAKYKDGSGARVHRLFAPDGKRYEWISLYRYILSDAHPGWDKLAGKIKKLTAN